MKRGLFPLVAVVLALAGAAQGAEPAGGPAWTSLSAAQQQALAPLQRDWSTIDATRKQKWLELSARFPSMPADERARVQQRMADWARLTPAERTSARMQFQEVRQLPAEERQARWDAYKALPEEERKTLAQRAKPAAQPGSVPAGTTRAGAGAPARAAPGPRQDEAKSNMVTTPAAAPKRAVAPTVVQAKPGATTTSMATRVAPPAHNQTGLPKIAATPGFVDPATLLPRRGAQGAAVRSAAAASEPAAGK